MVIVSVASLLAGFVIAALLIPTMFSPKPKSDEPAPDKIAIAAAVEQSDTDLPPDEKLKEDIEIRNKSIQSQMDGGDAALTAALTSTNLNLTKSRCERSEAANS